MIKRVHFDTGFDGKRGELWEARDFDWLRIPLPPLLEGERRLLLFHTQDVAKDATATVANGFETVADYVNSFGSPERTAALFLSGGDDAWYHIRKVGLKWAAPSSTDHRLHVCRIPVGQKDEAFADRVVNMIGTWEPLGWPDWDQLYVNWGRAAMDALVAMMLLLEDGTAAAALVLARGLQEKGCPFREEEVKRGWAALGATAADRDAKVALDEILSPLPGASDEKVKGDELERRIDVALRGLIGLRRFEMVRTEVVRELERERAHVSHTLFENGFGGGLVPGWREERGGPADIVRKALADDAEALCAVREAADYWRRVVEPALIALIDGVTARYGFETSDLWKLEVEKVARARERIGRIGEVRARADDGEVERRTAEFWESCDTVRRFLGDLRSKSMEFYTGWKPGGVGRAVGA